MIDQILEDIKPKRKVSYLRITTLTLTLWQLLKDEVYIK